MQNNGLKPESHFGVVYKSGDSTLKMDAPVSVLPTVNKKIEKKLLKINVKTVGGLFGLAPFRFEDWKKVVPISELSSESRAVVKGRIQIIDTRRSWKRKIFVTEAIVSDGTGTVKAVWFNQPYISKILKAGDLVNLAGKIEGGRLDFQIVSPIWEKADKSGLIHTERLVPIYRTAEGLTQKHLRFLIATAWKRAVWPTVRSGGIAIKDWIPGEITKKYSILNRQNAVIWAHFPKNDGQAKKAMERLKFEEIFKLQVIGEFLRRENEILIGPKMEFKEEKIKEFVASLPFKLTVDQKKAAWEIIKDIGGHKPMNRILEGDVGSGKTAVAALSAYMAKINGYQTAVMAPTHILAVQHFENFAKYLEKFGCSVAIRTSKNSKDRKKGKKILLCEDVIVGTHALISGNVEFKNLGLIIVDEQHRFGVGQRRMIKDKSGLNAPNAHFSPHFLSLSATPIPRTLALTVLSDLDLSVLKNKPDGRIPVITRIAGQNNRKAAYDFAAKKIMEGRQAFIVCPLIESGDSNEPNIAADAESVKDIKSVKEEYERLKGGPFSDFSISMLHGRMKHDEKEKIMKSFAAGEIQILVSTSVIEVGVDVPNTAIVIILGANRFGLAQLHQLRGRVGRSNMQSYCILFSDDESEKSMDRLNFFSANSDGFKIAEYDLKDRGPGEVFGKSQSGFGGKLNYLNLSDSLLIKKSRNAAKDVFEMGFQNHEGIKKIIDEAREIHLE